MGQRRSGGGEVAKQAGVASETVAPRYGVSREAQDTYALQSQQRTAAAQERGLFKEEIVSFTNLRPGGEQVTLDLDEGNRPSTTREGLAGLPAVLPDREGHRATVSAGNSSQLSDGAAALVLMEAGDGCRATPGTKGSVGAQDA
jgi:acetyl-CoA C-acetyltransferase